MHITFVFDPQEDAQKGVGEVCHQIYQLDIPEPPQSTDLFINISTANIKREREMLVTNSFPPKSQARQGKASLTTSAWTAESNWLLAGQNCWRIYGTSLRTEECRRVGGGREGGEAGGDSN